MEARKSLPTIKKIQNIKGQIESFKLEEQNAQRAGDLARAAEIRYGRLVELNRELEEENGKLMEVQKDKQMLKEEVDAEDVAEVVANWTGIPVSRMLEGDVRKLIRMEERLKQRVVGQEEGITAVSSALRRARSGLQDPNRPIGSFIFLGPTGVGKTELAKALAEFMFDNEQALIRIDMSEYLESHTTSRLVGSPPGYVGFGEGGQLTEPVRRRPHSVVLFDEIEKAHPDVMNLLLQVLDEGHVTDAQGHQIDFKNTVIIMTSNVGAELIQKESSIGFVTRADAGASYGKMKEIVLEELKKRFKPEFLNRVDEKIVFHPLSKEDLLLIIDIMINDINDRLTEKGLSINLTKKAKTFLVDQGYDPKLGARPLRRSIEEHIEDKLSEEVLKGKFPYGTSIKADLKDKALFFVGKSSLKSRKLESASA